MTSCGECIRYGRRVDLSDYCTGAEGVEIGERDEDTWEVTWPSDKPKKKRGGAR